VRYGVCDDGDACEGFELPLLQHNDPVTSIIRDINLLVRM
jgi:hypothetical protein